MRIMYPSYMIFLILSTADFFASADITYYSTVIVHLAKYYKCDCVHLFTTSEDNYLFYSLSKNIAQQNFLPTNVFTDYKFLSEYITEESRCYNPLQVLFGDFESLKSQFPALFPDILFRFTDRTYFKIGVWLFFLPMIDWSPEDYLSNMEIPFDSLVLIADINNSEHTIMKEIYKVRNDAQLRYIDYGMYSVDKRFRILQKGKIQTRRQDLEGVALHMAFSESVPICFSEIKDGEKVMGGLLGEIWRTLEDTLNFTTILHPANDTFSLIMELYNDVDVVAADVSIALLGAASQTFSSSLPLLFSTIDIYFKDRGPSLDLDAQFAPLSLDTWLSSLAWLFVASVFLFFACKLSDEIFLTEENISVSHAFLLVSGALCGQGSPNDMKKYTCRFIFFITFGVTTIILSSYSANLASYLTIVPPYTPFSSLVNFYEIGVMEMLARKDSHEKFLLQLMREVYSDKHAKWYHLDFKEVDDTIAGFSAICSNRSQALIGTSAILQYHWQNLVPTEKEVCNIIRMPNSVQKVNLGFTFAIDSQHSKIVNHYLFKFLTAGLSKRIQKQFWPFPMEKIPNDYMPVDLANVPMVFAILAVGVALSVFVLILEVLISLHQRGKIQDRVRKQEYKRLQL